jgi:hypothetical protein
MMPCALLLYIFILLYRKIKRKEFIELQNEK